MTYPLLRNKLIDTYLEMVHEIYIACGYGVELTKLPFKVSLYFYNINEFSDFYLIWFYLLRFSV